MKIQTLEEAISDNGAKFCIQGPAGVGKTPLALTLPGRGLIASAEKGLRSLKDRPSAGSFGVVTINTIADLSEVVIHMRQNHSLYDWFFVDSISEIAEVVINEEKAKSTDPRKAYGKLIDKMDPMLKDIRDLPMDVVVIGKTEEIKEEETGRVKMQIMIPGSKVAPKIPYLFDEVFLMLEVENADGESTAWLQTRSDKKVRCRDRSGRLDAFEAPDLGAILKKIKASRPAETPEANGATVVVAN